MVGFKEEISFLRKFGTYKINNCLNNYLLVESYLLNTCISYCISELWFSIVKWKFFAMDVYKYLYIKRINSVKK